MVTVKSVSFSTVSQYVNCSERVWMDKILGVKKHGMSQNVLFGTAIHAACASYYRSLLNKSPLTADVLFNVFRIKFEAFPEDELFETTKTREQMYTEAKAFIGLFLEVEKPKAIISIEKPFTYQLTPLLSVVCQPDIITRDEDGTLTITDLKTSSRAYSEEDIRRVTEQTAVYSFYFSEPVHMKVLLFLRKKKPEIVELPLDSNSVSYQEIVDKFTMVKKSIEAQIHFRNRSWMCGSCPFSRQICNAPASEAETERMAA